MKRPRILLRTRRSPREAQTHADFGRAPRIALGRSRPPAWIAYLLAGAACIALYFVLAAGASPAERVGKVLTYSGLSLSASVALLVGVLRHRPAYMAPWLLLVLSQLIYFSADTSFYVRHDLLGLDAFPSVSDLLYFLHYPVALIALALFIRRRTPGRDVASLLDAGILTLGVGLLSWVFLLDPNVSMPGISGTMRLGVLYQPLMDIPVLALALRLMLGSGQRTPSFYLLVGNMVVCLMTNTTYGLQQLAGTYSSGSFLDGMWLFSYLLLGASALHPSMRRVADRSATSDQSATRKRLALLGAASLMAPATLLIQDALHGHVSVVVMATASGVLFLLVIARLAGLVSAQREAAIRDGLTGLHNRRFFEEQLDLEVKRAARTGAPLAVLIVDVDRFKDINDTYGHPGGDRVLCQIAARLRESTRDGEVLARYGGEEFATLVPGVTPTQLHAVAERLRHAVSGQPMEVNDKVWIGVTVSLGAASLPHDGATTSELVAVADRALYTAKAEGRNRVIVGRHSRRLVGAEPQDRSVLEYLERLADDVDLAQSANEHSSAIARWSGAIAEHLGLDDATRRRAELAARLHDVGKVRVPEQILNKRGTLTPIERALVEEHADHGARLIALVPGLTEIAAIVRQHHECFDGTGYPQRLSGEEIRIEARIIFVCDAFSAMRSHRPYRSALSFGAARQQLIDARATQFDPRVVDAFLTLLREDRVGTLGTLASAARPSQPGDDPPGLGDELQRSVGR